MTTPDPFDRPACCDGWGEVIAPDRRVVACPVCYPDSYETNAKEPSDE